jgi:uncharacterized protein (DUF2336 family)
MLNDFPFIASLASSESARDRRIWLRVATDHFVAAGSSDPEAIEAFVEAMTKQLETADRATRLEIARKLAPCAWTPAGILAALESVDADACDYILEHGAAYTDRELARSVVRGGRRAVAVAKRKQLDARIVQALAAQGDIDAPIALAANASARLEGQTLFDLIRRARRLAEQENDLRLANALLGRRPMRVEMAALFLVAKPSDRIEILLAAQRLQLGRAAASLAQAPSALLDELELAAVARRPEQFVARLAEALDCGSDLAQRIVDDPSGEPLAVALASLGAANEVLVRVLISNDLVVGASYQRIRALARLNNALSRNAAIAVMAALCDRAATRIRHRPSNEGTPISSSSHAVRDRGAAKAPDLQQRVLNK